MNKGFPSRYIVFDTETTSKYVDPGVTRKGKSIPTEELRLQIGCAKGYGMVPGFPHRVDHLDFTESSDFHDWISMWEKGEEKIWVFAHNAGFDIRIVEMFRYLAMGWYSLWDTSNPDPRARTREPMVVLDNPPMMIRTFRPDGQEVFWCDTFQWINESLAKIGTNFGMAKGVDPGQDAPLGERFAYCRQDVDVLDHALRTIWQWLKNDGIPSFHPTRAGQSRLIYRTVYEKKRIIYHEDTDAIKTERMGYYGGKTDLYQLGPVDGPIHQLDINSLYPYVMRDRWYPVQLIGRGNDEFIRCVPRWRDPGTYTAEVILDSPDVGYPVRNRDGTWFCRGRVRTVLPGPELRKAFDRGHVVAVGRWNRYRMGRLFDGFIDHYWKERCKAKAKGDKVSDTIVKLLMNSLYGKFAQLTGEWIYHDDDGDPGKFGQGTIVGWEGHEGAKYRCLAGKNFVQVARDEAKGAFIAIASFVTSYARCYMDGFIEMLGGEGYYYQATDSLYVGEPQYQRLKAEGWVKPGELGMFKDEVVWKRIHFYNIHHLDKDDVKVRGSIRGKSRVVGNDQFEVLAWESLKSGVFKGNVSQVFIRHIDKKLKGNYVRREILPNKRTRPWAIDNRDISPEDMKNTSISKCRLDRY